jgi:hypothetical protein
MPEGRSYGETLYPTGAGVGAVEKPDGSDVWEGKGTKPEEFLKGTNPEDDAGILYREDRVGNGRPVLSCGSNCG